MVLRETFWTEGQPTTSPQERELQKAERWATGENGDQRDGGDRHGADERLKEELRQAAVRGKFRVATAFYWLSGGKPNMTIREAEEIVTELQGLEGDEYPFVD